MLKSTASITESYPKDVKLLIHSATWSPKDHILELDNILQGASSDSVERELLKYVIDNIEPVGWRAVCRSFGTSVESEMKGYLLVDVMNVSQEKLESSVIVRDIVGSDICEEMKQLKKNFVNKNIDVPLIHLYPMAEQENNLIDIEITTEVIEQVRFFFKHIWQPWDMYEDVCNYDYVLIKTRMKIFEDIKSGIIPACVASEMASITLKAKEAADQIKDLETRHGITSEPEIDPEDIAQMMRLNKDMKRLQERYEALRDPALREITLHQEQFERKELLKSFLPEDPANIFVVASSVSVEDLAYGIAKLPELLKGLPQIEDGLRVKTCPSLQFALDFAETGDLIALLPGSHLLKHLGALAKGGTICGLGKGVSIMGSLSTGDVLFDLNVSKAEYFVIRSVDVIPLDGQTCFSLHEGKMLVQQCSIQGGLVGISLLSGSECRLEDSLISNVARLGIDCKSDSKLIVSGTKFERCLEAALRAEENAKINLLSDLVVSDCPLDVLILDSADNKSKSKKQKLEHELNSRIISAQNGEIKIKKTDDNK